jgi:hypothetical protein
MTRLGRRSLPKETVSKRRARQSSSLPAPQLRLLCDPGEVGPTPARNHRRRGYRLTTKGTQ